MAILVSEKSAATWKNLLARLLACCGIQFLNSFALLWFFAFQFVSILWDFHWSYWAFLFFAPFWGLPFFWRLSLVFLLYPFLTNYKLLNIKAFANKGHIWIYTQVGEHRGMFNVICFAIFFFWRTQQVIFANVCLKPQRRPAPGHETVVPHHFAACVLPYPWRILNLLGDRPQKGRHELGYVYRI